MSELRLVVDIPFAPPKAASPNSRVHWSKRSKETRVYREAARLAAVQAFGQAWGTAPWDYPTCHPEQWEMSLDWTIYIPKHGRAKDYVNAVASLKGAEDGIADALGMDDRWFSWGEVRQERDPEGRGRTVAVVTARRKEET